VALLKTVLHQSAPTRNFDNQYVQPTELYFECKKVPKGLFGWIKSYFELDSVPQRPFGWTKLLSFELEKYPAGPCRAATIFVPRSRGTKIVALRVKRAS